MVNPPSGRAAQRKPQGRVLYAISQSSAIDPRETVPDLLVTNEHTLCSRCDPASRAVPAGLTSPSSAVLAFGCSAGRSAPGPSAVPGCRTSPLPSASPAGAGSRSRNSDSMVTARFENCPLITGGKVSWHRLHLQVPSMTGVSDCPLGRYRGPCDTETGTGRGTGDGHRPSRSPSLPLSPGSGRTEALSTHGTATAAAGGRSDRAGKDASECRGEERGERGRSGARQSRPVPVGAGRCRSMPVDRKSVV